jgi:hypothetical protein
LNFFKTKAEKYIQMRGGSPFSYIIVPDSIEEDQTKFFIQSGGRVGALAGGGNTQFYLKQANQLIPGNSYRDWMG